MIATAKRPLTARQRQVYDFIRDFIARRGYQPSIGDISTHFQFGVRHGAWCHLKALEKKGWITRDQRVSRGIVLVDQELTVRRDGDSVLVGAVRLTREQAAELAERIIEALAG